MSGLHKSCLVTPRSWWALVLRTEGRLLWTVMTWRAPEICQVAHCMVGVVTVVTCQTVFAHMLISFILVRSVRAARWFGRLNLTIVSHRTRPGRRTGHRLSGWTVVALVAVPIWIRQATLVAVHASYAFLALRFVLVFLAWEIVPWQTGFWHRTSQGTIMAWRTFFLLPRLRSQRAIIPRVAFARGII